MPVTETEKELLNTLVAEEIFEPYFDDPCLFVQDMFDVEPTEQQRTALLSLAKPGAKVSIRSGHGCFGEGTKVLMADRTTKCVEDLLEGDLLCGEDGSPKKVLSTVSDTEEMFEVLLVDGTSYIVNKSHMLCLVASQTHGKQKRGIKSTVYLENYLKYSERKARTNIFYRSFLDTDVDVLLLIDPYILGCWLGDGSSDRATIHNVDPEVLEEFRAYCDAFSLDLVRYKDTCSYKLVGKHNLFKQLLARVGVLGNKHIPLVYKQGSLQQRLELLAGLLDTDGSLDKRNKRVFSIIQKNKQLALDIQWLARSVGCHATLNEKEKYCTYLREKKYGLYYEVTITRNVEKIPTRIPRKQAASSKTQQRNNLHFGIRSVTSLGPGRYYGFTLEGDGKFLGADFTVLHNTGKTTSIAWLIMWFLYTRTQCRILCTAPSAHQLFDNLWPEIHKWHERMLPSFRQLLELTSDRAYIKGHQKTRFAFARTARKENPEALQGAHADNMLFIIDEASGVPEQVFEVAEGTMTTPDARVIMTSNPTRTEGYFYNSQVTKSEYWTKLHFNCINSEIVHQDYVDSMLEKYGENSSIYRVRVLGEFPSSSDDTVIPLNWIEESIDRPIYEAGVSRIAGLDVARFGDDASALVIRAGGKVTYIDLWRNKDLMETCGKVMSVWDGGKGFEKIYVDAIGLGSGVADRLKELGVPVIPVNVAESTSYKEKFMRLRDELWWDVREEFEQKLISLPDDVKYTKELREELAAVRYGFQSTGKIKIESKDDMKKRRLDSPNLADAFCLTYYKGGKVRGKVRAKRFRIPNANGWT